MNQVIDMIVTQILGPEYDPKVRLALSEALRELRAVPVNGSWGVAGSQEVAAGDFRIGDQTLHVEAETYAGISISGPKELVSKVAAGVADRRTKDDRRLVPAE